MRKFFLIFISIAILLFLTVIGIQKEYILTKDEKIVCDAILEHALEFNDPTSIKITGGTYDQTRNMVFVRLATKNNIGILVSHSFCIYGDNFEHMQEILDIEGEEGEHSELCAIQGELNLKKINIAIYRGLRG